VTQDTVGNVLLVLSSIPANISVIAYHLSSRRRPGQPAGPRWWHSPWGRHLMVYMVAFALVLDLGLVRLAFGDSWWFAGLRVGAYLLLVGALYQRMFLMVQAYREGPPVNRPGTHPEGEAP
jgi:hypothetical protein